MEEKIKITLANGTQIDVMVNGNCYISDVPIDATELSDDNLLIVDVDGTKYENVTCSNYWEEGNKFWFILRTKTVEELKELALNAKIEFLMAMQGVIE